MLKFVCKGSHIYTREESEKKGTKCFGLIVTAISLPLGLLGEGTKAGSKDEYRKKRKTGGNCFQIFSNFSFSYSNLIGNKLDSFPCLFFQ